MAVDAASEAAGVVKVDAEGAIACVGVGGMVNDKERRLGFGRFISAGWVKQCP
jgi:hypothetical protein